MSEIQAVKAFVESLDLGSPSAIFPSSNFKSSDVSESLAYVVGGSIISFKENTPSQQKKDTIFWLLFAQLAANAQFDRLSSFDDWYSTYRRVLGQTGWSTTGFTTSSLPFTGVVKNFMLDQLKPKIPDDQYQVVVAGLKSLESAGLTGEATTILGRATGQPHAGFNQVDVPQVDSDLNIALFTQTFFFASPDTYVTYTMFVDIPQSVEAQQRTLNATLAKSVADSMRDTLYARVEGRIADNVRPIIISPEAIHAAEK